MKFTVQLKQLLKTNDVTVTQLGRAVKVSPKTIYSWLNGQHPRDITQVKAIANYFNVTLDQIFFGENPKQKSKFEDYQDEIEAGTYDVILRRVKKV